MSHLKYSDKLLSELSEQLFSFQNYEVGNLNVILHSPNGDFKFSFLKFMDVLSSDLYWDERGNWSEAKTLTIDSL